MAIAAKPAVSDRPINKVIIVANSSLKEWKQRKRIRKSNYIKSILKI
jgi:hypothetical protein